MLTISELSKDILIRNEFRLSAFDRDNTAVYNGKVGKEPFDGVVIDQQGHAILFSRLQRGSNNFFGFTSRSGGQLGALERADTVGKVKESKKIRTDDPALALFNRDVLYGPFWHSKDYIQKSRGNVFNVVGGIFSAEQLFAAQLKNPIPGPEPSLGDYLANGEVTKITQDDLTIELSGRQKSQYVLKKEDKIVKLKLDNDIELKINLEAYLSYQSLHKLGDGKLIQLIASLAAENIVLLPSEGMKRLGIVGFTAPSDVRVITPEQIFFLDDKPQCVALLKMAGCNAHIPDHKHALSLSDNPDPFSRLSSELDKSKRYLDAYSSAWPNRNEEIFALIEQEVEIQKKLAKTKEEARQDSSIDAARHGEAKPRPRSPR